MNVFTTLGVDHNVPENDLKSKDAAQLTQELYTVAFETYQKKSETMMNTALPIFKRVQEERGATVKDIMVPISDGIKQIGVVVNLESTVNTEGRELVRAIEKNVSLAIKISSFKLIFNSIDFGVYISAFLLNILIVLTLYAGHIVPGVGIIKCVI